MFTFTWARLGIFFAIIIGIPLLFLFWIKFSEWADNHEKEFFTCAIIFVCLIIVCFAGYMAFFLP